MKSIKAKGKKCGIVFNPDVEIDRYADLFPLCDMIVVMTVFAGRGGQKLIPECLDRIFYVKTLLDRAGLGIPIEADGGIGEQNVRDVIAAGATILVAGSSVYKSPDPTATIKALKNE